MPGQSAWGHSKHVPTKRGGSKLAGNGRDLGPPACPICGEEHDPGLTPCYAQKLAQPLRGSVTLANLEAAHRQLEGEQPITVLRARDPSTLRSGKKKG